MSLSTGLMFVYTAANGQALCSALCVSVCVQGDRVCVCVYVCV